MGRWGIVSLVVFLGWQQHAQAADAEELIRQGIELRKQDQDAEALRLFQQAYELQQTPKALAQIGLAEQALGRWGAADRHVRQAMVAANDPWLQKHWASLEEALRVIGGHVGGLEVRGSPAGAEVRIDGEFVGRLPLPGPVSTTAGGVVVEVRATGHFPIMRSSNVAVDKLTRETFNLQDMAPRPESAGRNFRQPPTEEPGMQTTTELTARSLPDGNAAASRGADRPTPNESGGSSQRIVAYGAAGLALGALTFGVVEHVQWQSKVSSFESMDACDIHLKDRGAAGCQPLYNDGMHANTLALVGYGLAGGLLVTAAIVYLTAPSEPKTQTVACAANPLAMGVGCLARF